MFSVSCKESTKNETRSEVEQDSIQEIIKPKETELNKKLVVDTLEIEGVGAFNTNHLELNLSDLISIYNLDGSVYGSIQNDMIEIGDYHKYVYDLSVEDMNLLISSIAFYPDYGVWYIPAVKKGDKIFLKTKDGLKYIKRGAINFLTYEYFIMHQWIGLTDSTPLRVAMNDTATIVTDFIEYDYMVTEVSGEWIKVTLSDMTYPGEKSYQELGLKRDGWVKWRSGADILVNFYYD